MFEHARIIFLGVGILVVSPGLLGGSVAEPRTAGIGLAGKYAAPVPGRTIQTAQVRSLTSAAYGSMALNY